MKKQETEKVYKEDSTKGGSLINPVSYKGDVMVQVWMDSRVLATLCKWLENEGEIPRFLSHVVKMPLEMLADHLVKEGRIEMVDDTKEARMLLEGRFHVGLNKGKRGKKNLMHNIVLSSKRGTDLGSRGEEIDYTKHDVDEPIEMLSQEEVRAKYFKEQTEMKIAIEKEKQKAIDGGLVVEGGNSPVVSSSLIDNDPPVKGETREKEISRLVKVYNGLSKSPSVKEGMSDEEWEVKKGEIAKRDKERLELEQTAMIDRSDIVSDPLGKE